MPCVTRKAVPTNENPPSSHSVPVQPPSTKNIWAQLSILDRLISALILLAMILGVVLGRLGSNIQNALGVSVPIATGLIVMIWPVLTKLQYENRLPGIFSSVTRWKHIGISVVLNWIVGPFLMLGLAWVTLPDLPTYRTDMVMVGIARCIAMVMIWNTLAMGGAGYCVVLVIANVILQVILHPTYAVLFTTVIGRGGSTPRVSYGDVASSVLIYLCIPLVAGAVTRYLILLTLGKRFLHTKFPQFFSPVALLGPVYAITVLFPYQGRQILHNIGPVFQVIVPLVLSFVIMWTSAFVFMHYLPFNDRTVDRTFDYDVVVFQAFTAASNSFELAIAVAIAVCGVDSQQALAPTVGPFVEIQILLSLTWVALLAKKKLGW